MTKTRAIELLKEMQNNCRIDWSKTSAYNDTKRLEKAEALTMAIRAIEAEYGYETK